MNAEVTLGLLGVVALWFLARQRSDRAELAKRALDVAAGSKADVKIQNVEAIEERRLWMFVPGSSPGVQWFTDKSPVDLPYIYDSVTPGTAAYAQLQAMGTGRHTTKVSLVDLTSGASLPLIRGGLYNAQPRMGSLPMSEIRLRWEGVDVQRGLTSQFRFDTIVPDDVWLSWWREYTVTVGQQVDAGGIQIVPPSLK